MGYYLPFKDHCYLPAPEIHLDQYTTIAGVSLKFENDQLLSLKSWRPFSNILSELYLGPVPSHALVCSLPSLFSALE